VPDFYGRGGGAVAAEDAVADLRGGEAAADDEDVGCFLGFGFEAREEAGVAVGGEGVAGVGAGCLRERLGNAGGVTGADGEDDAAGVEGAGGAGDGE
jgi:hypothetical protein